MNKFGTVGGQDARNIQYCTSTPNIIIGTIIHPTHNMNFFFSKFGTVDYGGPGGR